MSIPMAIPTRSLAPGCKINLFLRILGRRPDGYHELSTLFFPLPAPGDVLHVEPGPAGSSLRLTCSDPALETDANLVAKAYRAFVAASGLTPDLHVHLDKQVPMGAGLGGGSADAAAMLALLNEAAAPTGQALSPVTMASIAARLGADVPFFLLGTPALASGIGEQLQPVQVDLRGQSLLLVCPAAHVPTAWAYTAWDELQAATPSLTPPAERIMDPFCPAAAALANDFETAVLPAYPELRALKQELLREGADQAVMSGSGASFFALYADREAARRAEARHGQQSQAVWLYEF